MTNVIDLKDQGLEMIICSHCDTLYTDLKRKGRSHLYCPYCGKHNLDFGRTFSKSSEELNEK